MGMGPGGSGSDFLGISVVSSNPDHWVFSEGLLRAIAFSINGIDQSVNSGDGFCRWIGGADGLMVELAFGQAGILEDGEEMHSHPGELIIEGEVSAKERFSIVQTTLLCLRSFRKFLLILVSSFRKMVMPSMEKYSGVRGVMTSFVAMRMHFSSRDIPGERS